MANKIRIPDRFLDRDSFYFCDDFEWFVTAHHWTSLVADTTPTVSVGDARGGVLALYTDTTDNNEVAVRTTAELFLPTAGRPLWGGGLVQYSEANTDDANVFFGFASAIGANLLVDNGAGMRTSGSIAAIYKVDGGTVWRCHTRDNSGATDTISVHTAGGSAYQELQIHVEEKNSSEAIVTFMIDGQYMRDANGTVIAHDMAYASLTEMNFGVYAKTGGSQAETVNVDLLAYAQTR